MKEAIAAYVALKEDRHRMTLEALADVKAGRVHGHAEVEAWAQSLGTPKRKTRR